MLNENSKLLILIIISFVQIVKVYSQNNELKGCVTDKKTGETLPFVHIIYNTDNKGISTDIDGGFIINNVDETAFLKFSYIGYKTVFLRKSTYTGKSYLKVKLDKKLVDLEEITVYPGENPAHRIIKAVLRNKKRNNPNKLKSYRYKTYHKMYFTADIEELHHKMLTDTLKTIDSTKIDSSYRKTKDFFESQHIFMMESVSERKFKYPDKVNENVLVSRVSGFKNLSFIMLASQLQSFSFYDEMFTLLDKRYVSPVSRGCTNRYFFNIEDTTFTERGDTVFSISYRPRKGRNFEGLKGILNINSYKYAVQSVIAEPVEKDAALSVRIKQNSRLINNEYWFPYELNTDILFNVLQIASGGASVPINGIGKSYIDDIVLNEDYRNSEFSAIELEVDKKSFTRTDSIWQKYRKDSLNKQELRTYEMIDSVGDAEKLDAKLKIFKTLTRGFIPIKFINLNPFNLFKFNMYEGYRPELRIETNDKISNFFNIEGYGAYGFKDKQWKYGANINLNIAARQELKFNIGYRNDVFESSGYKFYEEPHLLNSSESYRYFLLTDMSYEKTYSANLEFRFFKHLKANFLASRATRWNTSNYNFVNKGNIDEANKKYNFNEAGLQLKYAPNDKKAFVAGELLSTNANSSPLLFVNFIRGFKTTDSDFEYTKMEAKININFLTKSFGRTHLQLVGGKIFGDLPYFMMYNGHGSYYKFDVDAANSFATMRMNEFLNDEFIALYFRQDFGSLLFKGKKFRPKIVLATNVIFGNLNNKHIHKNLNFNTLNKGYYESGIIVNNIFKLYNILGYGFGVYYRYGNYAFPKIKDNFAYKLTLTFEL